MTYSITKFEVATSNGLGDTFTRNVTDGRTDGRRTDFDTKLIKKKAGITMIFSMSLLCDVLLHIMILGPELVRMAKYSGFLVVPFINTRPKIKFYHFRA